MLSEAGACADEIGVQIYRRLWAIDEGGERRVPVWVDAGHVHIDAIRARGCGEAQQSLDDRPVDEGEILGHWPLDRPDHGERDDRQLVGSNVGHHRRKREIARVEWIIECLHHDAIEGVMSCVSACPPAPPHSHYHPLLARSRD